MAGDIDRWFVGHGEIGAIDEFAADLERDAAGSFDRDRAIRQLQQAGMAQHDAEIGELNIAIGATTDRDFGVIKCAGADDITPIGTFRDLADNKAHDITSTGRR